MVLGLPVLLYVGFLHQPVHPPDQLHQILVFLVCGPGLYLVDLYFLCFFRLRIIFRFLKPKFANVKLYHSRFPRFLIPHPGFADSCVLFFHAIFPSSIIMHLKIHNF